MLTTSCCTVVIWLYSFLNSVFSGWSTADSTILTRSKLTEPSSWYASISVTLRELCIFGYGSTAVRRHGQTGNSVSGVQGKDHMHFGVFPSKNPTPQF